MFMVYYSALKRKHILTYAIMCMNLKDILLSELSSHKWANAVYFHLDEVVNFIDRK